MREAASCWTRWSAARPSRLQAASAFPSLDAQRRASPPITVTWRRLLASQASTWSAAATACGSGAGMASSTSEISRQCAPVHLR
jgi:hypothetical protein